MDKDPWCCAGDKLRINVSGFDAGWLNAMKSVRHLVRALDKKQALEVIDQLIAEYTSPLEQVSNFAGCATGDTGDPADCSCDGTLAKGKS